QKPADSTTAYGVGCGSSTACSRQDRIAALGHTEERRSAGVKHERERRARRRNEPARTKIRASSLTLQWTFASREQRPGRKRHHGCLVREAVSSQPCSRR